jgi:serine/threonine-protein kinase RsbW
MGPAATRDLLIRNDLAELERLAASVRDFCREHGVDDEACHDLLLAMDESVSNTIRHGYIDRDPHEIRVRVGLENRDLFLEVEDDARPFNPLEVPEPDVSRPVEERPLGGLGIHLLRQLMNRLEYRHENGRNILRVTRRVGKQGQ